MKEDLNKIFGEKRTKSIEKYVIIQEEHTVFKSTIFAEFDDEPIYMTHVTPNPTLITNYEGLSCNIYSDPDMLTGVDRDELNDFYAEWSPIDYINLAFTNLQPKNVLGDVVMFSTNGVFKLTNVSVDEDDKRLFYDDAVLIVTYLEK